DAAWRSGQLCFATSPGERFRRESLCGPSSHDVQVSGRRRAEAVGWAGDAVEIVSQAHLGGCRSRRVGRASDQASRSWRPKAKLAAPTMMTGSTHTDTTRGIAVHLLGSELPGSPVPLTSTPRPGRPCLDVHTSAPSDTVTTRNAPMASRRA